MPRDEGLNLDEVRDLDDDLDDEEEERDERIPRKVRNLIGRLNAKISRLERRQASIHNADDAEYRDRGGRHDTARGNQYKGLIFDGDTGQWYRKDEAPATERKKPSEAREDRGDDISAARRPLLKEMRRLLPKAARDDIENAVDDVLEEAAEIIKAAGIDNPAQADVRDAVSEAVKTVADDNPAAKEYMIAVYREQAEKLGLKLADEAPEGDEDEPAPEGEEAEGKSGAKKGGESGEGGKVPPKAPPPKGGSKTKSAPAAPEDPIKALEAKAEVLNRRMLAAHTGDTASLKDLDT